MVDDPRFPTGKFQFNPDVTPGSRQACIAAIREAPAAMRAAVHGLNETQLNTPYRDGGWTVRQVVHHVPDSHMNAYIRMKFAATEDAPAIKAYDETKWAELPEAKTGPADMSVTLLDALHRRWVMFLRALTDDDFAKVYVHPELGPVRIDEGVALYSWHCRHHAGHIKQGLGLSA